MIAGITLQAEEPFQFRFAVVKEGFLDPLGGALGDGMGYG